MGTPNPAQAPPCGSCCSLEGKGWDFTLTHQSSGSTELTWAMKLSGVSQNIQHAGPSWNGHRGFGETRKKGAWNCPQGFPEERRAGCWFSGQPLVERIEYREEKERGGLGMGKLAEAELVVSLRFALRLALWIKDSPASSLRCDKVSPR